MLIEASKGGHIGVVQLLLDFPNWMYQQQQPQEVQYFLYSRYKQIISLNNFQLVETLRNHFLVDKLS